MTDSKPQKAPAQDVTGIICCLIGGFYAVTTVQTLLGREGSAGLIARPIDGLNAVIGPPASLVFCIGLSVLGCALFLRPAAFSAVRPLGWIVALSVGFSFLTGGFVPSVSGALGGALFASLGGLAGKLASAVIGVLVLTVVGWVGLLASGAKQGDSQGIRGRERGSATDDQRTGGSAHPGVDAERSIPGVPADGVSAAEAALLVSEPKPLKPAIPGGVPEGTRPLPSALPAKTDEPSSGDTASAPAPARSGSNVADGGDVPAAVAAGPDLAEPAVSDDAGDGAEHAGAEPAGAAAGATDRPRPLTDGAGNGQGGPVLPAWELEEDLQDVVVTPIEAQDPVAEAPVASEADEHEGEQEPADRPGLAAWEQSDLFQELEAHPDPIPWEEVVPEELAEDAPSETDGVAAELEELAADEPAEEELGEEVAPEEPAEPVLAAEAVLEDDTDAREYIGEEDVEGIGRQESLFGGSYEPPTAAVTTEAAEEAEEAEEGDEAAEEEEYEYVDEAEGEDDEEYEYEEEDEEGAEEEPVLASDEEEEEDEEYEYEYEYVDEAEDGEEDEEAAADEEAEEPEVVLAPQKAEDGAAAADEPADDTAVEPASEPAAEASTEDGDRPLDPEELVFASGRLILEQQRVAVSMLQRRFKIDFDQACAILDELQSAGLIGPYIGGLRREILMTAEEWEAHAPTPS